MCKSLCSNIYLAIELVFLLESGILYGPLGIQRIAQRHLGTLWTLGNLHSRGDYGDMRCRVVLSSEIL